MDALCKRVFINYWKHAQQSMKRLGIFSKVIYVFQRILFMSIRHMKKEIKRFPLS